MENLAHIGVIRDILSRHGFHLSKGLGQNFLINPAVCPKMAELGGARAEAGAIEIGPGVGVLTRELADRCRRVVSIELDSRLLPVLEETLAGCENVRILNADALTVDMARLIREEFSGMPVIVCANLPYYITSPLIMGLLEARLPIESVTVMVQKEAARRLCALPGTRESGAVTCAVWYYAEPRILFPVSRGSFLPAPAVDSAAIRLDIRKTPPVAVSNEGFYFKIVRAAFSQRRKTAVNAISSTLKLDKAFVASCFEQCGILPAARAETLNLKNFSSLAEALLAP